jgi:hypothetical protein
LVRRATSRGGGAGAPIRLAAYGSLSKRRIDLEFARETLGAAITRPRNIITVDSVIKTVANTTAGAGYEHGETSKLIMSLLLIHATCRTHPAHPEQSAEAAPGAGNKLLQGASSTVLAPGTRSHVVNKSLWIIESVRRERSVHVLMDASHGRLQRYRAKALAHAEIMSVGVRYQLCSSG